MRAPDDLASLAADFRALTARQRRDIMGALSSFEQVQLTALLRREEEGSGTESLDAEFDHFSSWLAQRLRTARDEGRGQQRTGPMTEATRAALLDIAGKGFDAPLVTEAAEAGPASPRSLIDTVGGFLVGRQRS